MEGGLFASQGKYKVTARFGGLERCDAFRIGRSYCIRCTQVPFFINNWIWLCWFTLKCGDFGQAYVRFHTRNCFLCSLVLWNRQGSKNREMPPMFCWTRIIWSKWERWISLGLFNVEISKAHFHFLDGAQQTNVGWDGNQVGETSILKLLPGISSSWIHLLAETNSFLMGKICQLLMWFLKAFIHRFCYDMSFWLWVAETPLRDSLECAQGQIHEFWAAQAFETKLDFHINNQNDV